MSSVDRRPLPQSHSRTMPSATSTKSAMLGTKRKAAPVKNVHVKENKKARIDSGVKSASKSKSKPMPVKKTKEASESDSDSSDSDGGVPLNVEDEGEDDAEEALPKATDGLHPDRAKAVATNSTFHYYYFLMRSLILTVV